MALIAFFNIKSANFARKLNIIQITFAIHDFKLIILFLSLSMKILPLRDLLVIWLAS